MRCTIFIGVVLACLLGATASADDQHYQDFIVGDQAVGMGGAFTAIASDPSGGWYNPAGIVDVRNTSLSLSANLYGIQDTATDANDFLDPENAISKLTVVPSSAGFVQALGRIDMYGNRPFAVGMTLVVPSYRKFTTSQESVVDDPVLGNVRQGYNRTFQDETLWAGFVGAMRLGYRLSLGLGIFLIHRSVQDSAYSYAASNILGGEFQTFNSTMTDLDFSNDSLVASIGLKLKLGERFFFGAMIRSPSLTIYSKGNMRFARAHADVSGAGFMPTPEEVSVSSESRINGEARVGLAFVIQDVFKLAADVSAHMPVSYTLINMPDGPAKDALLLAPEIKRNFVINGNLGAEVTIAKKFSIALGGFTNFSSAPEIPSGDVKPAPARIHMFGGAFAVGYSSKHTLTRVGLQAAYGKGDDVHAVNDPSQISTGQQGFVKVPVAQTHLYFFLSSTFRY